MSDDEGSGTIIPFPGGAGGGVGFAPPPLPEAPPPLPAEPAQPAVLEMPPATGRRSPLETLASLSDPAEMVPVEPPPLPDPPGSASAPVPGEVPAAFRSEAAPEAAPGPGLGSLSLAAMLAVSVAAMRGIHSAVTAFRASREQRKAVAEVAEKAGTASKEGGKKGGRDTLTPSHEWGSRSLDRYQGGGRGGGGWGPGGGRGSGGGPGGPGGRRGAGSAPAPGPATSPSGGGPGGRKGSGSGKDGGTGAGASPKGKDNGKTGPSGADKSRSGKGPAGSTGGPVHRPSQGGGPAAQGKTGGKNAGSGTSGGGAGGKSEKNGAGGGAGGGQSGGGRSGKNGAGGTSGGQSGGGRSGKNGANTQAPGKGSGKNGPGKSGAGASGGTAPGKPEGNGGRVKAPTGASGTGSSSGTLRKGKGKKRGGAGGPGGTTPPMFGKPGHKEKLGPGMRHGTLEAYQDCDCRCRRCMKAYQRYRTTPPGANTLKGAVRQEFERRWAKRMRTHKPVFSRVSKKARKKAAQQKAARAAASAAAGTGPNAAGSSTGPGAKKTRGGWGAAFNRARARAKKATTPPPGMDTGGFTAGPGGTTTGRSTPFGAAGMASAGEEVITVVREDRVGDAGASRNRPPEHPAEQGLPATGPAALGPAPVKHTQRPGTRRPRPMPPAPKPSPAEAAPVAAGAPDQQAAAAVAASVPAQSGPNRRSSSVSLPATSGAVHGMSAEHATEITIDDVLDDLSRLTQEGFAAHDTCVALAERARRIRYDLEELAAELRTTHNVIGNLTSTAMSRLAESMDLLARKADEMKVSSLEAAEQAESADQAMADHYKPIQLATADAGLRTPSARVHNEN
ncbi:hypothetical protein ACFWA9_04625 [Kitasatospora sp. NPDC059973]|uniref:hypothetical protein n=1 Tax=Kitasatospora sp. NPDC059973 TaxID=3347020 RepID=UPI0036A3A7BE